MKILHNRVLVKPIVEEITKGGLIMPKSEQNKNIGEVVLIGEKVQVISVGDIVSYHSNCGAKINYKGFDCLFLNEEHEITAIH